MTHAPSSLNPLVKAAYPVFLTGASVAQQYIGAESIDALKDRLLQEMESFDKRAQANNFPQDKLTFVRYVLCVFLDEMAFCACPEWGHQCPNLQVHFFGNAIGGEQFFVNLDELLKRPSSHLNEIELMYLCLALGYQGRYRVEPSGAMKLRELRKTIYLLLAPLYELTTPSNKPKPSVKTHRVPLARITLGIACVLLFSLFFGMHLKLEGHYRKIEDRVAHLFRASLEERADRPSLDRFLIDERKEGLVQVRSVDNRLEIHLMSDGLFQSGSAELGAERAALIKRIGVELAKYPGKIEVVGHTDDRPIHRNFSSNEALSLARAQSVAEILQTFMAPTRLSAKGVGASQPLILNEGEKQRAANRRVELDFIPDSTQSLQGRSIHVAFDPH